MKIKEKSIWCWAGTKKKENNNSIQQTRQDNFYYRLLTLEHMIVSGDNIYDWKIFFHPLWI